VAKLPPKFMVSINNSHGDGKSEEEDSSHPQQQQHSNQQQQQPSQLRQETTSPDSDFPAAAASGATQHQEAAAEEGASKRIRLAKAQAEIDRILNNPVDPPFDFESEMKKVVSITPPLIQEGTSEFELEQQVSLMEEDLYSAVKAQDFTTAAQRQHEISQLHVDDCGLVLQVNSAFYRAFSEKDIDEMERVWLKDRSCICIHPSFQPLSGIRDVMHTWRRMFESSAGSFQRTWMEPRDIRLTVKATTAVVTCEEHVFARLFVRGKRRNSELVNKLMATNIFRKVGGKWYMTYHHSSWHADSEAAKMALKRSGGGRTTMIRNGAAAGVELNHPGTGRPSRPSSSHPSRDGDENGPTGIESITGFNVLGPFLGDDGSDGNKRKPDVGRLRHLIDKFLNSDQSNAPGEHISFSIIDGSSVDDEDDDDDDDDDDDEDEDGATDDVYDDDDDGDGSDEEERNGGASSSDHADMWPHHIQRKLFRANQSKVIRSSYSKSRTKDAGSRQKCIGTLRKLASEGRISPKQKRVLLTDIISSSSKGQASMVEVAYKLLCSEGKDTEDSEEEFVDQCQVFAQSLAEDHS
jgi:SnoaL-like domain